MLNNIEKCVVFGDIHGRKDKAETIFNLYNAKVDRFISTGDNIDGIDSKGTIEVIQNKMGALVVGANHESHYMNAMFHQDEDIRHQAVMRLRNYHVDTLSSYGIYPNSPTPSNIMKLRDKMEKLGHLDYFLNRVPFFENINFAVIHGSLSDKLWTRQKREMEYYLKNFDKTDSLEMPYQFGEGVKYPDDLNLALSGINKILISGHFHSSTQNLESSGRKRSGGKHLLLATNPKDDFIVVYESWTNQIKNIYLN